MGLKVKIGLALFLTVVIGSLIGAKLIFAAEAQQKAKIQVLNAQKKVVAETTPKYLWTVPLPKGKYFWRTQNEDGSFSALVQFEVNGQSETAEGKITALALFPRAEYPKPILTAGIVKFSVYYSDTLNKKGYLIFELSPTEDFPADKVEAELKENVPSDSFTTWDKTLIAGNYFWRINVVTEDGREAYSSIQTVAVQEIVENSANVAPYMPELIRPEKGEKVDIASVSPLKFSSVLVDPNRQKGLKAQLKITKQPDCAATKEIILVDNAFDLNGQYYQQWDPAQDSILKELPVGTYFWCVRVWDEEFSAWSEAREFALVNSSQKITVKLKFFVLNVLKSLGIVIIQTFDGLKFFHVK